MTSDLRVHYGFVWLLSNEQEWPELGDARAGQQNGLLGGVVPGVLSMITGLHTGSVPFEVAVADAEPAIDERWEEVVEVAFVPPSTELALMSFDDFRSITLPDRGPYRARYCASGMDAAKEQDTRMDGDPILDRYLLQLWPAPAAPERLIRVSSDVARSWHREAASAIPPTPEELDARRLVDDQPVFGVNLDPGWQQWGGAEPSPALQATGHVGMALAQLDPDLAGRVAAAPAERQRSVALWAVEAAGRRAPAGPLDWAAATQALRDGVMLPTLFYNLDAAMRALAAHENNGDVAPPPAGEGWSVVTRFASPTRLVVAPVIAAFNAVSAARDPDPLIAALGAVSAAASGFDDPSGFLDAARAHLT